MGNDSRQQGLLEVYARFDEWRPLVESDFHLAHAVLMCEAGGACRYRRENVVIRHGGDGGGMLAVPAFRVPWLMQRVFEWLRTTSLHPLLAALLFHYEVAVIHPFKDGNGRMCRLWMALLGHRWMPHPLWRQLEWRLRLDKARYYTLFRECVLSGEPTPFLIYMLRNLLVACEAGRSAGVVTEAPKGRMLSD